MESICLVSCVSKKRTEPAKARDLYVSPWFRLASRYADSRFPRWFILSAHYGLVDPNERIRPYEKFIGDIDGQRWAYDVYNSLIKNITGVEKVTILAGVKYRQHLIPLLERNFLVDVPMLGMGIGKQLQYLKRELGDE